MNPLNDLDSRRLFFQRIFGLEDSCPEQYQAISEKILKKCGGVPLVIISIASLLASQECLNREKWEKIQKSLVFELETSPNLGWVRHVLNLSYNDLSHCLKTCFLYLGVYPEDHKIEKDNLLRCWIAEGFVSHEHDLSPEEVAESYFNELVNRSIIQPTGFEYGELAYCKVHDILLNFIMLKSSEENFITRMDEQHIIKGDHEVRRLCLQLKNTHYLFRANMKLSQIRSVTIFGYPDWMTYLPRFQLLRVLDLYNCDRFDGNEFLDLSNICKLFQLRYLRTNSHRLHLPKQIRGLENLQTLDIRDAIIQGIPSDVIHLKSLRHLNIPIDVKLPNGIGRMVTLRSLGFFNVAENSMDNIRDLGELTNLMDLDLISINQVVKGQGPSEKLKINFLIDSLGKLTSLRSLYVSSIDGTKLISPTCDFLSCWSPPPHNLQRFCMSFCTISKVPGWISQLDKLTSLKIKVKELLGDAIQLLGELPCLIYLDLSAAEDPKCDIFFDDNAYPSLREFGFAYTFASVAFGPRTMAKLQVLYLSFYKLTQKEDVSLSGIEYLLNLEKLTARIYNHGKIGVAFMDAILKHPRSETFNILFPRC
jgi:Leucine-rich repeat (LRR) protein